MKRSELIQQAKAAGIRGYSRMRKAQLLDLLQPPTRVNVASQPLVLSLFPGIGLLDRAFEEEGFCVVRGPDLLWGGDIRSFHPPAGKFDGVIGGPPCQAFSRLRHLVVSLYGEDRLKPNLIPEYERVVAAAAPKWFVMENVPDAPEPVVGGYIVNSSMLNNRWIGEAQNRARRFSFGTLDGRHLQFEENLVFANPLWEPAVCATAGGRRVSVKRGGSGKTKKTWQGGALPHETTRPIGVMLRLQGLPEDYLDGTPFTLEGKRIMVGNGVPLPMGRAVARAVKRSLAGPYVASGAGVRSPRPMVRREKAPAIQPDPRQSDLEELLAQAVA